MKADFITNYFCNVLPGVDYYGQSSECQNPDYEVACLNHLQCGNSVIKGQQATNNTHI